MSTRDQQSTDAVAKTPIHELWRQMGPVARLVSLPVYAYRYTFSPFIGHVCRHQPTCSVYALEALAKRGGLQGSYLTAKRVCRCHPWGTSGYDPVPESIPKET